MTARWRTVRTQSELDAVLADGDWAEIRGDGYFEVSGSASVSAWDSASVSAWDSASVRASGSTSVRAWDLASVSAWDSASVSAWDLASVRAWDSASVRAWGSASVRASGSTSVRAWDLASVSAWDSASVSAWDLASVRVWGSASVRASGSASVSASDSASVSASAYVAVHKLSKTARITGGVVIQPPDLDTTEAWLDYYDIDITDGQVVLFKGVDDNYQSERGWSYRPGEVPAEPQDWNREDCCGGGLHLSPRPEATHTYCDPTRYVACTVDVADVVVITDGAGRSDKVKVRRVLGCVEVDHVGQPIAVAVPE